MKYSSVHTDIMSIFKSLAWKAENIKTVPDKFIGKIVESSFIRTKVITGNFVLENLPKSVGGVLQIDIFTTVESGQASGLIIADTLDEYFSGKSITVSGNGRTQFTSSTLIPFGVDKDNNSLYRNIYSIPFTFYANS